jgi:hypothetical protein
MNSVIEIINNDCIHSTYRLHKDCILEILLKDGFYFTIKEAKEITANIIVVTNFIPHKVIIVAGDLSLCDEEARNYSTISESNDSSVAVAIVTRSLPQVLIVNFIIKIQKPKIPTKLFSSRLEALDWLNTI